MLRGMLSQYLLIKQEIIVLLKVEPTLVKGVPTAIKVRYNEPKHNHQCGSIVRGVPRDWRKGIHSVNKVPRPNLPPCTYCHQIGH